MNTSLTKLTVAIAFGSLALSAASTQASHKSSRIIGGTEAPTNTYPWIASLQSLTGEHFCGASLVAPEWIMTAAHCVEDEQASDMQVVIAEYDTNKQESTDIKRTIKRVISHSEYAEDHDIALLQLSAPVENGQIKTADSALLDSLSSGTKVKIMGWGNRSTAGEDFPHKLHEVDVELVSSESCAKAYENVSTEITDNMLCASVPEGGKDSCQGDSGGPLVLQKDSEWIQLGIVSFGEGCGLPDYPGVYTKVSAYQDWIIKAQSQLPNDDSNSDSDNNNDDDLDDFDFDQPFELPDYVLIETNLDSETNEPELRTLTLTNTNDSPLQISKIGIEHFALDDEEFGDDEYLDGDEYLDDNEYLEDEELLSEEDEDSSLDYEDEMADSDNSERRNSESDSESDDLTDEDHIEASTLFTIHADQCSNLTLEPNQSCDITISFSDNLEKSEYFRNKTPRHFTEDDYEDDDLNEDNFDEWEDAYDDHDSEQEGDESDETYHDEYSENNEDEMYSEEEYDNVLIIDELLTIETNDEDNELIEIPLIAAIELPEPKLLGPDYLEFNATNTNQTISESVEIENNSDGDVTITSISIDGSSSFTLNNDQCTSAVVNSGKVCTVEVDFSAADEAESEASLIVNYDNNESIEIPLLGLVYSEIEMSDDIIDKDEDSENLLNLLDWYFNGETPWGATNADAFELITNLLNENDESLLMTEIEGPATLDFDFSLEGDSSDNELQFIVDGKIVKSINGTSTKSKHSTELSAGKHTVQWIYKKKTQNTDSKAMVSNVRVKPKASQSSSSNETTNENGGGSTGFGFIALLTALLGLRRFRK